MKQGGNELVRLEQGFVRVHIAPAPGNGVGDALKDHPQLPLRQIAVGLHVRSHAHTHIGPAQAICKIFIDRFIDSDVLIQANRVQIPLIQQPLDVHAERVCHACGEHIRGKVIMDGDILINVYTQEGVLSIPQAPRK